MGLVKYLIGAIIGIFFFQSNTEAQTPSNGQTSSDSVHIAHERRGVGGLEAGHGWRTDADHFQGYFIRGFYEAEIGRTFLNAGAFSYKNFDQGFGFDFRLRMPWIFYPSGSHTNFSPLAGISFTVWPVTRPTVSVGFPIGIEYEFLIEGFPNISVSANAAPQVNLSIEKNTIVFDVRIGIRFD